MNTKLINIGNSKGIIIPSKILKLMGLHQNVQLDVVDNKIIIQPIEKLPRQGWEEMIQNDIKKHGEPENLLPDVFEDENFDDIPW